MEDDERQRRSGDKEGGRLRQVTGARLGTWCTAALEKASMGAMMQLTKAYRWVHMCLSSCPELPKCTPLCGFHLCACPAALSCHSVHLCSFHLCACLAALSCPLCSCIQLSSASTPLPAGLHAIMATMRSSWAPALHLPVVLCTTVCCCLCSRRQMACCGVCWRCPSTEALQHLFQDTTAAAAAASCLQSRCPRPLVGARYELCLTSSVGRAGCHAGVCTAIGSRSQRHTTTAAAASSSCNVPIALYLLENCSRALFSALSCGTF